MLNPLTSLRRVFACLVGLALCLGLLSAGGCSASTLASALVGKPVDARYEPAKVPTLVLVENYERPGADPEMSDQLAQLIGQEMTLHKVAPVVDGAKLSAMRVAHPEEYNRKSIVALAREVGAQQVVYVDLAEAEVGAETGNNMLIGRLTAQVRVVDVKTGKSLWPGAGDGYAVSYQTQVQRGAGPTAVNGLMLQGAAERIAKLFYSYNAADEGGMLDKQGT